MGGFRARPVLFLLTANVLFLIVAPRLWFEVLVVMYRVLVPIVGLNITTYTQALSTLVVGGGWLYVWRESFRRLHDRLSKGQTHSPSASGSSQ